MPIHGSCNCVGWQHAENFEANIQKDLYKTFSMSRYQLFFFGRHDTNNYREVLTKMLEDGGVKSYGHNYHQLWYHPFQFCRGNPT